MVTKSLYISYLRLLKKGAMLLFVAHTACQGTFAQHHVVYSPSVVSLQVVGGSNWQTMPIVELNGEPIHISFDEMSHDYHRYIYKIEHCDADWEVTDGLFESDYLVGLNGTPPIDNCQQSINTNRLYTHYSLTIPNQECRLKMSGNYQLTIFDENDDNTPILKACFMVVEPLVDISLTSTSNTDVDVNKQHQQVNMTMNYAQLSASHPSDQFKIIVVQNGKWSSAVIQPQPDVVSYKEMRWQHVRDLIFPAGNVYRKFEMLDLNHTTMGLDEIRWDGEDFHAFVQADMPRPSYAYDEAPSGAFYVRNSDNVENDIASDYAWVHFALKAPRQSKDIYINGDWTYDSPIPAAKMTYNEETQSYEAAILLKQGYYSYRYVMTPEAGETKKGFEQDDSAKGEHFVGIPSEGNFYQTKNTYQGLVYYRGNGERTDRLVGYATTR